MVDSKKVIILLGMPGSGKDTQADILENKTGLFRIRTSKLLEDRFNNADSSDIEMAERKKEWLEGRLLDPEWVASIILGKIKELHKQNQGIIFSASPRTIYEAEVEMPFLKDLYGLENIKVFFLKLSDKEAITRNIKRLICQLNKHPIDPKLVEKGIKICPIDGSSVVTKSLDNEETMKARLSEFYNRTFPIIDFLKKHGFSVIEINGEQSVESVHENIMSYLN